MKWIRWGVLVLLVIFTMVFVGCGEEAPKEISEKPDAVSEATSSRYDVREIQEYKGIRLDPVVGPRDNSISGIQEVDIDTYKLNVTRLVEDSLELTYDQVLEYPSYERLIILHCVEGWDATILWEGIKLTNLFKDAKPLESSNTVIFKAIDGYTTSLPIKTIEDRDVLMAYKANTVELPAALGYPFIIIAEDQYGYKWARWVTEMEFSDDEDYKGYWEKRGYDNDAEVPDDLK